MVGPEQLAAAGQTAAAYSEKKFGGPTKLTSFIGPVVIPTAGRILLNNPRRVFWLFMNRGVDNMFLGFDGGVGGTFGILIPPFGGAASMSLDEDGEEVTRELWAIAPGTSGNIFGFEIARK